jgi:membrane-anchored protein YejM (alkaline phosphatase superfamily)
MHNVVIIILDSVRKDTFDSHAPRLHALADIEFDRCYAPSSWSIPSHASLLTGTLPHVHGVHSFNPDYSSIADTFMDELPHTSIGMSANGAFSEAFNAETLFDEFESFAGNDEFSPTALSFKELPDAATGMRRYLTYLKQARHENRFTASVLNGLYVKLTNALSGTPVPKVGDFGASQLITASRSQVTNREPFVLVNNFIDSHGPMENHRGLKSDVPYSWTSSALDMNALRADPSRHETELAHYRDLYRANVEYLDQQVAAYIESIQQTTSRPTSVIITADHGEELLFDGESDLGHMSFSNALLHVPCLVVNASGADVSGLTTLLDLGTVATSLAHDGAVPDVGRETVPAERLGMLFYDGTDPQWQRAVRTVYRDEVRYEYDSLGRTHCVALVPSGERAQQETILPNWFDNEFEVALDSYLSTIKTEATNPDISEATRSQLSDLGYTM